MEKFDPYDVSGGYYVEEVPKKKRRKRLKITAFEYQDRMAKIIAKDKKDGVGVEATLMKMLDTARKYSIIKKDVDGWVSLESKKGKGLFLKGLKGGVITTLPTNVRMLKTTKRGGTNVKTKKV